MKYRKNEQDGVHFRTERVFVVNAEWYFQTRDLDTPLGPYRSKEKAEQALKLFLKDLEDTGSVAQAVTNVRLRADAYIEDDY